MRRRKACQSAGLFLIQSPEDLCHTRCSDSPGVLFLSKRSESARFSNGDLTFFTYYGGSATTGVGRYAGAGVDATFIWSDVEHFASGALAVRGEFNFMIRQGTPYRFVKDHLGSVRLVVNADTGAIVQRMDFDSFGRVLSGVPMARNTPLC